MGEYRAVPCLGVGLLLVLGCFGGIFRGVSADNTGNDDFASAETIAVGTSSGSVSRPNDIRDYYKVALSTDKFYIFNFTAPQNWEVEVSIFVHLGPNYDNYTKSGPLVSSGASWETRMYREPSVQDQYYYIVIESKTGTTNYNIRIEEWDLPTEGPVNRRIEEGKTYWSVCVQSYFGHSLYRVDVTNGSMLVATAAVADTPNSTSLTLEVFDLYRDIQPDPAGRTVTIAPGQSRSVEWVTNASHPSTYQVELHPTSAESCNFTYSYRIVPQNDGGSGRDAPDVFNETLTDTVLLPGSGNYRGWARDDDGTDWYSVEVTAGQVLDYELAAGDSDNGSLRLQLYNAKKAPVNSTKWVAPEKSETGRRITSDSGAGLWYINISGDNDYTLDLTLTDQMDAGTPGDAGDTLETSRAVVPQTDCKGLLGDDDTKDYFAFLGLSDRTLTVEVTMTGGNRTLNASLLSAMGDLLAKTDDLTANTTSTMEFIPAVDGPLHLLVSSRDATYSFRIIPPADPEPSISITSPSNGSILPSATFDISGTASDNLELLRVEVSQNGIEWTEAEGTTSWEYAGLTVGEGVSTVWARATDVLGNTMVAWVVVAYEAGGVTDGESPRVNITSPADRTMLRRASFDLTGTASDDYEVFKVEVSLSGIAWSPASGTTEWTYEGLTVGEGVSTVYVKATDFAGKSDTASIGVGFIAGGGTDTAPPQISITSPANGTLLGSPNFELSGNATDDFAVVKVEVSLNGMEWLEAVGTTDWTYPSLTVGEGISAIWARATDFSGNTRTAQVLVGYRAGGAGDALRPSIAFTTPANGTLVASRTFDLAGTASDDFSVTLVEVSQNGIAWLPANGTEGWTFTGLTVGEGISTVWARATDFSGNTNTTWILVGYRAAGTSDNRKPTVAITAPANGTVVPSASFNLTGTASDDFGVYKVEVSLSGIEWWLASGTSSWTFPGLTVGEGGNTVWARSTDFAGNTETASILVTYIPGGDTVKPAITLTSIKDRAKVSKGTLALLSGTASDNVAVKKVTLKVNGADVPVTFAAGVWTATNVSLKEGKNTLVVSATDGSGNVQEAKFTVTYEKPKSQPGFEAAVLAAALLAGLVLLGRRRR